MGFVKACDVSELVEGEILKVELADSNRAIAVYRIGEEVFATADICTHGEASLSEDGYVEDGQVVCSWHDGAFDIRTGKPMRLPCMDALPTYAVEVRGCEVFIDI